MTHHHLRNLVALAIAAAIATMAGTASAGTAVSQRLLLADNSLDTTSAERAETLRIVGQLADLAAAEQGVVAAAPFQASALATISWPIDHRFSANPRDPNSYYRRLDLAQQADTLKQDAKALFARQSGVQGTDVIGGLLAASEWFAAQPAGPRTLVISSNMWAYSPSDGLILKNQLSRTQLSRLIAGLARDGKVAALRGVCVFVVGAGLDPGRQVSTGVQLSMRAFWQLYFSRTGAVVRAWTPTLSAEPSC